eukprot:SM000232S07939  [mRNA]  locus=s232:123472:125635:+ [translate_table: standard]
MEAALATTVQAVQAAAAIAACGCCLSARDAANGDRTWRAGSSMACPPLRQARPRPLRSMAVAANAEAAVSPGLQQSGGKPPPAATSTAEILAAVAQGQLQAADAAELLQLRGPASSDAAAILPGQLLVDDFARVDTERSVRTGFPEQRDDHEAAQVVWGPGKTAEQVARIMAGMAANGQDAVLATRITPSIAAEVQEQLPAAAYNEASRTLVLRSGDACEGAASVGTLPGSVAILSAGTSDFAVAEEARVTAQVMGCPVWQLTDVGVAGLHRLLSELPVIRTADVVIVVAGMDGALPSVVAGLVDAPVIAVPTSIGYGAAFGGIAPLLAALNSCAPGVAVVNIDNGFGGAMLAARLLRSAAKLAARGHKEVNNV